MSTKSLSAQGFFLPPEWASHQATWLSYPHNPKSFFSSLERAQDGFVQMVKHLACVEQVHINVNDAVMERALKRKLKIAKVSKNVTLHRIPTNDAWCRDHGAIVLKHKKTGERLATNWVFNAWGGKYPHAKDNRVPPKMSKFLGLNCVDFPFVMEGGAIDVNGEGVLLTTERCLLNQNRNPQLKKKDLERLLKSSLGVKKVLWLKDGIVGDDTDGHIDDIARFVNARTIVAVVETNKNDGNYSICQENLKRLKSFTDVQGRPFRIVKLPMPPPMFFEEERLPASYANFYVANQTVLVPIFKCSQDKEALAILRKLFPQRKVVALDATDIVVGLGTCHCLTQQIPA